jgi:hypothetical protein
MSAFVELRGMLEDLPGIDGIRGPTRQGTRALDCVRVINYMFDHHEILAIDRLAVSMLLKLTAFEAREAEGVFKNHPTWKGCKQYKHTLISRIIARPATDEDVWRCMHDSIQHDVECIRAGVSDETLRARWRTMLATPEPTAAELLAKLRAYQATRQPAPPKHGYSLRSRT